MKKYIIIATLSISMNTYAQTPTKIDNTGFKFSIDLPAGATYDIMETSFRDESGNVEYKSFLQILMSVNNRTVSVTVDKAEFDKERLKSDWLTDDQTKIATETDHSIVIRTFENGTENHHLVFQKIIGGTSFLFIMYYQLYSFPEAQEACNILNTITE
jgi:hypothetical protein